MELLKKKKKRQKFKSPCIAPATPRRTPRNAVLGGRAPATAYSISCLPTLHYILFSLDEPAGFFKK